MKTRSAETLILQPSPTKEIFMLSWFSVGETGLDQAEGD